jgi:raffinose/stachyose/melibiose transport system permease protein
MRRACLKRMPILPKLTIYAFAFLLALVCLMPYVWVVFASLKDNVELFDNPFGLPAKWLFDHYIKAWETGKFGMYYWNTIIIAAVSVVMLVPVASLAAYAFSKIDFYFRNALLYLVMFGMIIPFQAYMISLYFTLRDLRLLNTYFGMIMPLVAVNIPSTCAPFLCPSLPL